MMDVWKLRTLPRPKSLIIANVSAALPRGVGRQVDRRRHRPTPAAVSADNWTWRNTPPLSSPLARTTPRCTTTAGHWQSANTTQYTASYFRSPRTTPSTTATTTNINFPTSTVGVKYHSKEIGKLTTVGGVLKDGSTDVTEPDGTNNYTRHNVITSDSSSSSSGNVPVPPHNQSTTSNYLSHSSVTQSHPDLKTCNVTATSDQRTVPAHDVTHMTSLSTDALSRAMYGTGLTSQHDVTSGTRDDNVNGIDVKAQLAEAENTGTQANSTHSQVITASMSAGEMTTYLSDDAGTLVGSSSDDKQVQQSGSTPLSEAIQVTSETGEMISDEDGMLSGSSSEVMKYTDTTAGMNDVSQVIDNTGETTAVMNDVSQVIDNTRETSTTANNATSESATNVDEHSTSDQSFLGDSASRSTLTVSTSSTPNSSTVTVTRPSNQTGHGGWMMSPRREEELLSSARTSLFSEGPTLANWSADDTFSLRPRGVLLKSANSTDSTVYWSSQIVIPLLTVAVILALCLLVIAVACAVRYAHKYCCCLAPRAGSYTPSPHGHTASKPPTGNKRQDRGVARPRQRSVTMPTVESRAAELARTQPAYRSIVVIGSDRVARRVMPTKQAPRPHWIIRQKTGSTWGNLSQLTNDTLPLPPPPPPLPSQTIVLGKTLSLRSNDEDVARRTVPSTSLPDGRVNVADQIHDSQPELYVSYDTK